MATDTFADDLALLRLLQLVDSGFPTGAFAFSHGLEGLVVAGLVRDEGDVRGVLRAQIAETLTGLDGPAMRHAYRLAAASDLPAIVALDTLLSAMKPVPAFRDGSTRVGRRLLASAAVLVGGGPRGDENSGAHGGTDGGADGLDDVGGGSSTFVGYRECVRSGISPGHHAVAFGVVAHAAGVEDQAAALGYGAGFVGSLAAAAVRLGVIGQGAAQRLLAEMHLEVVAALARAAATPIAEMGAYLPLVDVAGLRQPALAGRVFAS